MNSKIKTYTMTREMYLDLLSKILNDTFELTSCMKSFNSALGYCLHSIGLKYTSCSYKNKCWTYEIFDEKLFNYSKIKYEILDK